MGEIAIEINQQKIDSFCQKYHIRKFTFFGSLLRDDFGPDSDIDVLAEFEPEHIPRYDFFLMEMELTKLLWRKVDLLPPNFLSPEIRRRVISESKNVYG